VAKLPGPEWPLVTAAEMRALDRHTIETLGVPGELLMECAGRAVAAFAEAMLGEDGRALVVCGPGNNGGDGLVAARHLHLRGVPVGVVLVGEAGALRGDAAANLERARRAGVAFEGSDWRAGPEDVLVDALFGTGLARALDGAMAEAVRRANAAGDACPVLAVDLPSGLDADRGQPLGACVAADVTLTLGLPKLGLALEPGRSHAGRVFVARIGIADAAPGVAPAASLLTATGAGAGLRPRPVAGHKGTFGHVLVVAGSRGKAGAAALAGEGAARIGAGLVTLACPEPVRAEVAALLAEAMTAPLPAGAEGELARGAERELGALAEARTAVVLGPGLGRGEAVRAVVRAAVPALARPLVLDADGLVAFAGCPEALRGRAAATVLTPHPGEAAMLLGASADALNRDRVGAARELAERTGAVAVLKGAATVVAEPGGRLRVNPTGGPALATGGTGDVLAGAIGGLLAQGLDAFEAASVGAYVHGLAGDRLASARGAAGVLARDVACELPAAAASLRDPARAAYDEHAAELEAPRRRAPEAVRRLRGRLRDGRLAEGVDAIPFPGRS